MAETKSAKSAPSAWSLLTKVGEWLALPAAYLFFAGFLYAYYYFSALGVPTNLADIPVAFFPVYAFSVFMENWGAVLVWAALVLAAAAATTRAASWTSWASGGLVVLLLAGFPGCWWMARERGDRQAVRLRNGYQGRRVSFVLDGAGAKTPPQAPGAQGPPADASQEGAAYPPSFLQANADGRLILVTETSRAYYVLWQIYPDRSADAPVAELPRARLYVVPRSGVKLAEVKLDSVPNIRPRRTE